MLRLAITEELEKKSGRRWHVQPLNTTRVEQSEHSLGSLSFSNHAHFKFLTDHTIALGHHTRKKFCPDDEWRTSCPGRENKFLSSCRVYMSLNIAEKWCLAKLTHPSQSGTGWRRQVQQNSQVWKKLVPCYCQSHELFEVLKTTLNP